MPVEWDQSINRREVMEMFAQRGCEYTLVKVLANRQDNDKNQIYVGADLADISLIPSLEAVASETSSRKTDAPGKTKFTAAVPFAWISPMGDSPAPEAKLIFYPQYPEVRFSGFLRGSSWPPRSLLSRGRRGQDSGRVLVLGVNPASSRTWGIALAPESLAAAEFRERFDVNYGVFELEYLDRESPAPARQSLLDEVARVAASGWLDATRLQAGEFVPCRGTNCAGYTLEAHLGIEPNGRSEPDYEGWELKQHGVTSFERPHSGRITLMTPEPDGGTYVGDVAAFIRTHGYLRPGTSRYDFAGVHRVGMGPHARTGTTLSLRGFHSRRSFDADGAVELRGRDGALAASWSFEKLMNHWKRKHNATCFVPSMSRYENSGQRQYRFSADVFLGEGAQFGNLLVGLASGTVVYDPGLHVDGAGRPKRRSQFRVGFRDLTALYDSTAYVTAERFP